MEVFLLCTAVIFTLFGFITGRQAGFSEGAEEMISVLEDNGFLKVKSRTMNEDGSERIEYAKVDSE